MQQNGKFFIYISVELLLALKMNIEKYLQSGKLEQYVLGLASLEERREVEELSKRYQEINDYIVNLHGCMNSCSEANEIPVSDEPKQKTLCKTFHLKSNRNLVAERVNGGVFSKIRTISWSAGIASFFVIGLSTLSFFLYQVQQNAKNKMALLETQLHHLKLDNESLLVSSESLVQQAAVLNDANTQLVSLRGLDSAPQAHGIVYWNKEHNKSFLSICNLPETPEGHQFCVWADVNGKHQKVGVLNLNNANLLHNLSFTKKCNGFCVTLEKEGAGPNPNVEKMFVKGEMSFDSEGTID